MYVCVIYAEAWKYAPDKEKHMPPSIYVPDVVLNSIF